MELAAVLAEVRAACMRYRLAIRSDDEGVDTHFGLG